MEYILSLSYGKDSLACLGAIEELGWPLDRIAHAEVWATGTIPADLPPMVEFKAKADRIIRERWGIEVEHVRAKCSYEDLFYMVCHGEKSRIAGKIYGWPFQRGPWCNSRLKQAALAKIRGVQYIGIAADEPNRFHNLSDASALRWWRLDGLRRTAENGARKTTCFLPSTQQPQGAAAGSVTTRVWISCGSCGRTTQSCGH